VPENPAVLRLSLLPGQFSVCRLKPSDPLPTWATNGPFCAITRTAEELSIVCPDASVPDGVVQEPGWRLLKVAGPLDFSLVGVLASLVTPLAQAGISIFALSTYDTDYLLVKKERLAQTLAALQQAGHQVTNG